MGLQPGDSWALLRPAHMGLPPSYGPDDTRPMYEKGRSGDWPRNLERWLLVQIRLAASVLQIGCRHVCDAWLGTCQSWLPTSSVLTIKIDRLCPPAVAVIAASQSLLSAVQHSLVKARYQPIRHPSSPAKDQTECCSRPSFSLPLRPLRL